jgi:acyl-homoserine lactone acylase PvdQ
LNVTSLVSVTGSGAVVNRITHIATETFTVTNTSSSTIAGPIQLLLSMGSSGITPVGQSGTYLGNPYWTASSALAPGAFVTFTVELNYATAVGFISAPTIYSGGL